MASGQSLVVFTARDNLASGTGAATPDRRNGHPVLDFDASTDEIAEFRSVMPRNYSGGGVTVVHHFSGSGITTGNVRIDGQFERVTGQDKDSDSFATAQSVTQAVSATDGIDAQASIPFTNGAQMDSVVAGDVFRYRVTRDANNGADTAAADMELSAVEIFET